MKKKILFVVSTVFTATGFLKEHFKLLSSHFDIYLVGNFKNMDKKIFSSLSITDYKSIPIHRKINIFYDVINLFKLRNYINKMNFFSIHSITPKAGLISALAGKFSKVKIRIHIFTGQVWHTKSGVFRLILMNIDKIIAKCNTHLLVDSESQRKYLIKKCIVTK